MPLIKIEQINPEAFWAIWLIDESAEDLYSRISCSDQENDEYALIHNEVKKLEWLSARNALNEILNNLDISANSIKDGYGKPHLDNEHFISLAHSYPFAAAILNKRKPVGIDIEKVQDKLLKVVPKFLNPREIDSLNLNIEKACVYWTAKETLYKIYGKKKLSFKENLFVKNFQLQNKGNTMGSIITDSHHSSHTLHYFKFDNYFICFNTD